MNVNELGSDDVGLLVPPVIGLEVVVEFLLVGPDELILVYLLARAQILQHAVVPIVLTQFLLRQVLPLACSERRALNRNRKLASHHTYSYYSLSYKLTSVIAYRPFLEHQPSTAT